MNNLIRIRIAPEVGVDNSSALSNVIITSPRTSVTKDITTSTTGVFLCPLQASRLAIYCDKKLLSGR